MYFNGTRCPAYAIDLNSENMDFCQSEIQCWAFRIAIMAVVSPYILGGRVAFDRRSVKSIRLYRENHPWFEMWSEM